MAAFMTSRISAQMPRGGHAPAGAGTLRMPALLREPFSVAMSQSILMPAFVALLGVIAALFLVNVISSTHVEKVPESGDPAGAGDDGFDDGDDYVEYILRREAEPPPSDAPHRGSAPRPVRVVPAHNGFRIDDGRRLRPVGQVSRPAGASAHTRSSEYEGSADRRLAGEDGTRNKHYASDPERPVFGRHSS
jgi:hypothetical protein